MKGTLERIGPIAACRPNWRNGVVETFEFKTYVSTSRDGSEQREALRQTPRIGVTLSADTMDDLARRLAHDLHRYRGQTIYLPLRWRSVDLAAQADAGATQITVSALPWWTVAGVHLVIETGTTQELVEIAAAGGSTVTLTGPLQRAAGAGSLVMLAVETRYPQLNTLSSIVNTHYGAQFDFAVEPASLPLAAAPAARYQGAHEGYPVFITKPDWTNSPTIETDDMREVSDFSRGLTASYFYRDHLAPVRSATFRAMTQAQLDELLGTFYALRGSQGWVWTAGWGEDFKVASPGISGNTSVTIAGDELRTIYAEDPRLTTLAVVWPDGCTQFNRIVSVSASGGDSIVAVADKWRRTVDSTTRVTWGTTSRLMGDRLEVNWITSEHADVKMTFKSLPNDWIPTLLARETKVVADAFNWGDNWGTYPWTNFNLISEFVPLGLVDRGRVIFNASVRGRVDGNGSDSYQVRLGVWFFNASGQEMEDEEVTETVLLNRALGDWDFNVEIANLPVPVGCRSIRVRGGVNHSTETEIRLANLTHADWGLIRDMEDLKCP